MGWRYEVNVWDNAVDGPYYWLQIYAGPSIIRAIYNMWWAKRNAIPLFGKIIQPALQKKIIEKRVKDIYICLDSDAIKNALNIAEKFMSEGLNVHLIEINESDASELGFLTINKIIEETPELTF